MKIFPKLLSGFLAVCLPVLITGYLSFQTAGQKVLPLGKLLIEKYDQERAATGKFDPLADTPFPVNP